MVLAERHREILRQAINAYDFPAVTYDFAAAREIRHPTMRDVERTIRDQLISTDPSVVRDGLSNVLYWGYARVGYQMVRVGRFRDSVTHDELGRAGQTFRQLTNVGVCVISRLGLAEFSALSFISKIRMFLDPGSYVVMDLQILKLRDQTCRTPVHDIAKSFKETSIRVSKPNEKVYESWSSMCKEIARQSFAGDDIRAVDVERGIFTLIQKKQAGVAAEIVGCG